MQLCYMMLIIGENTLVYCFLKVIIVLNSTAASEKSLSGSEILRKYRGVKSKCLKVEILDVRLRLEDGQQLLLNVIKEAAIAKAASIRIFSTNHLKNAK